VAEDVKIEEPCKFMRACNHYFSLVQTDCLPKLLAAGNISKMAKPLYKGVTYEANLNLQDVEVKNNWNDITMTEGVMKTSNNRRRIPLLPKSKRIAKQNQNDVKQERIST
jgi:hypothetical protein